MASSIFIGWFGGVKYTTSGSSVSWGASLLPDTDNTYDLGSASFRWKSAYVGTSVLMGGAMALGTTSTLGVVAQNTTAAAAGAQQISPGFDWVGQGWKTDATAASQEVRFRSEVLPVQGTSAPSGMWRLGASIAGGALSYPFQVGSGGTIFVGASTAGGAAVNVLGTIELTGNVQIGATNGSPDVILSRPAANRLRLASGDAFNLAPTAFASLPTGSEGDMACVTDSNTATWGATIAGGGANNVLAFFNGTNWTVAGA